jgi:hypothetical protein
MIRVRFVNMMFVCHYVLAGVFKLMLALTQTKIVNT